MFKCGEIWYEEEGTNNWGTGKDYRLEKFFTGAKVIEHLGSYRCSHSSKNS